MFSPIKVASTIKVTSTYDIEKALVGISSVQHPEAYRLLTALRNIAVAEQEAGSIYEIAGNAVSNHTKDTKIAQLTAQVSRLQTKLADTETKLAESDTRLRLMTLEAEYQRNRAKRLQTKLADTEFKLADAETSLRLMTEEAKFYRDLARDQQAEKRKAREYETLYYSRRGS